MSLIYFKFIYYYFTAIDIDESTLSTVCYHLSYFDELSCR